MNNESLPETKMELQSRLKVIFLNELKEIIYFEVFFWGKKHYIAMMTSEIRWLTTVYEMITNTTQKSIGISYS